MRFGLFYEHQLPRPWEEGAEYKLLKDALDQVELADQLGFDNVWAVEHHFLEEYSHSSAPEVFLAAASQRTSRIRLGHGIVLLPSAYNHTARVVERINTLDLLSDGRVDFGTGESSSNAELDGFGIDRDSKRAQWEEHVEVATRMMVEEPFAGWDGNWIQMPPRNVIPKPRQKPHPPLWVACSQRETIHLAATKGMGALTFAFVEPSEARHRVDDYYETIASEDCVPAGFDVNANIASVLPLMCHRDEQTAIDRGIDGAHFFGYALGHFYLYGHHRPGVTHIWDEFEKNRSLFGFDRETAAQTNIDLKAQLEGPSQLVSLRGAIGDPDQVRGLIRQYEDAGVDQLIFISQAGRNRHEDICESMELFAAEVMPEFAERDPAHQKAKAERLAPAIESALARREDPRDTDPEYHLAMPVFDTG
jgi:alkanesulfonate monooxygenase SsuD/methylene tetrahydromethanopterin reductase-like flavin-dependent oxidoreductase (luciferase family)